MQPAFTTPIRSFILLHISPILFISFPLLEVLAVWACFPFGTGKKIVTFPALVSPTVNAGVVSGIFGGLLAERKVFALFPPGSRGMVFP